MGWARRSGASLANTVSGNGTATWNAGNLGATPVINDRIIAVVDCSLVASQPRVSAISDSSSLRWARDLVIETSHNGYFEQLSVWSAVCTAGVAVNSLTFTSTVLTAASSGISCAVGAYSGLAVGFGLGVDQNGVQDLIASGAAAATPSTLADSNATLVGTNKANQLVIGAFGDAGISTTLSNGVGFTTFTKTDVNNTGQCLLEDKDSGATGFPQQATVISSGNAFYMMGILVYRLASPTSILQIQIPSRRPAPFRPGLAR